MRPAPPAPPRLEAGVVVVGAGVAGLAAAARLRAAGVNTMLLEAGPRIGGRAHTILVGTDPFDLGATWLHDADRNPLAALARPDDPAPQRLVDTGASRHERLTAAGRPVGPEHQAAYDAAWDAADRLAAAPAPEADTCLRSALASTLPASPWAGLVALWEGPIIAAADAGDLGLADWRRNRLEGRNLAPPCGLGAWLAARLATAATLRTPATCIDWSGPGVCVHTPRGTLAVAAAIVTISTGLLAAGAIRFDPPLPPEVADAAHRLPMGLLTKLALPGAAGLGLDPGTVLVDRDGCMTFIAQPFGRDHLMGFVGGRTAWALAHDPAGLEALAREQLTLMLGADAARRLGPATASAWGADPLTRGAYAYAGPGDAPARDAIATAFPGERLLFAGEAPCTDGLAGTVGGAFLSGTNAAERLLAR